MTDATISLLILAGTIVLFVTNRLPVGVVAIGTAMALYFTGVLTANQALAGFGDPVVVFIAALFVVSEGIDSTGVTTWAGQNLIDRAGEDRNRLLTAVMVLCALLTALISLNGSVAALLPMVVVLATRIGVAPSQMLMPLAFAGSAGSLLMLTGSPVNVLVSDASRDAGGGGFGFFEYAVVGVPLLVGTMAIVLLFGARLLPSRRSSQLGRDLSRHQETLTRDYALHEGFYRLRVQADSRLIGTRLAEVAFTDDTDVTLVGIQARSEHHAGRARRARRGWPVRTGRGARAP
ncbi:SLC13 family permease [Aeromicrobium sp. UC242_57]|uniref:SLC13 family permease n=1 Tax=Aeromicrobium sp. UC242_57 TaxID=3374624 RepID=UPI00379056AA